MIDQIREKFSSIDGIKLKNMQINFGKENIIEIEILDINDYTKWEYFCECLSRNTDSVHIIKKYPKIFFKLPLSSDELKVGFEALSNALDCKYYLINEPKEDIITLIIKVTNLCNLDCKYCYDKPFRDCLGHNGFLDIEKIDHAIDMATKYAKRVVLIFHGGEPTLPGINYYDRIFKEVLTKYPYAVFEKDIQSNGTLINDEWCEFLNKSSLFLGSSYNATQEDLRQNYLGDGEGAETTLIRQAFNNVKQTTERGVVSGVIDVLTKENHHRIKEIYDFYKREKVDASFNEINAAGEANKHQFLFITPEDQKKYKANTIEYFIYWLNDQDERVFVDRYASEYIQILLTGNSHVCHNGNLCLYHWVGINSNGDVYPCDRALSNKYRIGNIMDFNSFDELYNAKNYQSYANERNEKLNNRCSQCDLFNYCHGGCPMVDIDANNDASKANSYACKMQRMNIECAYKALFNTTIETCNWFMRCFLIDNCLFLPKEIPILLDKLGIAESFKDYNFDSDDAQSLKSKEFELFTTINTPYENLWITKDFKAIYDMGKEHKEPKDTRFEVAVEELKKRADMLQEQLSEKEC